MSQIFWISCFGALGVLSRAGIDYLISSFIGIKWLGIFIVNIMGSFLFGFIYNNTWINNWESIKLPLLIGFCGGFTTFSTFTFEILTKLKEEHYFFIIAYTIGSILFSGIAMFIGFKLAQPYHYKL